MFGQDVYTLVGPCSAESEEQVMTTAAGLQEDAVFRAGVWKPRTAPESFRGAGAEALRWLQRVQRELGRRVATEVITAEQCHQALDAGIDHLWIGARTSANPVAVQTLADVIASADHKPAMVWVKNPVNDDADLWMGNIRRMLAAGVRVGAIHRGCGHRPCWTMAHRLRLQMPDIPLLLDPSHLSGDATKIASLCERAVELDLDGLMVEVHPHPDQALSDSAQQITPRRWREIFTSLMAAPSTPTDVELNWLRAEMDEVDDRLWQVLSERMEVSRRIGLYKQQKGMPVIQPERYEAILHRRLMWAAERGIADDTVRTIMDAIHIESQRHQC